MTTPTEEIFALDLDWDLIQHLAIAESVMALQGERVTEKLIEDEVARRVLIFQTEHVREYGTAATPSVLEDEFPEIEIGVPQTVIGDLIVRLRERYMRNHGRGIIKRLALIANDEPAAVGDEMMRRGRELVELTAKRGEVFTADDVDRAMSGYHKRARLGQGPSIGYKELDEHFYGLKGVTFLLAAPKTYKSWFTINAVLENAIRGQNPYLYSLELPADEADFRLRCMAANIPYWKYIKNCLTPDEENRIRVATQEILETGSYKVGKPEPGERTVDMMVERALNSGADCIFIDQLQYMENRKGVNLGSANNTGDYWEVANDLRDQSDEIPIFVVHQFNRSVMNAKEMPEMQQAKGSSAIEEVATLQLALWSNKEMRKNNLVHLGTLASRNFGYGTWEINVQLSYGCKFEMMGAVEDEGE